MKKQNDFFFEAFDGLKRLAPGSEDSTAAALDLYGGEPKRILDMGCGTGASTLVLAKRFPGAEIVALDKHAPYLRQLNEDAKASGVEQRIRCMHMAMEECWRFFDPESFDLIWAEGSIYIVGFAQGLKEWKRLLKMGGCMAVSELTWLSPHPSEESRDFWAAAYPEMTGISDHLSKIRDAGYQVLGHRILPPQDWLHEYYGPLEANLKLMTEKYGGADPEGEARLAGRASVWTSPETAETEQAMVMETVDVLRGEMDVYARNRKDYSYVFYVMRKL